MWAGLVTQATYGGQSLAPTHTGIDLTPTLQ